MYEKLLKKQSHVPQTRELIIERTPKVEREDLCKLCSSKKQNNKQKAEGLTNRSQPLVQFFSAPLHIYLMALLLCSSLSCRLSCGLVR